MQPLRYVALGDSYTIGTSVATADRWPDQLVARLVQAIGGGRSLDLVANLAVNGYASRDVVERELPQLDRHRPEFASVLVGVNDVVRGVPPAVYRATVAAILDDLLGRLPSNRILAVETPDYTVTPQGAAFGDPELRSTAIGAVNAASRELATERAIAFVGGIFELSRAAAVDRSLVAHDGLHPSGRQYARWVDLMEPVVREMLAGGSA